MNTKNINRRRFLGLSTLASASLFGWNTFSLSSCKKEKDPPKSADDYTAIVIGSGFGGAVSALRLTEKGINTLLVEMGKFYDVTKSIDTFSPNLPPDKRSTWLKTKSELPFGTNLPWSQKYVGVLDRVDFPNMNVYRNICLGGGSISNGGVLLEPQEIHFNQFVSPNIDYQALKNTYFPRVKNMLKASKMPDDLFNSTHYKFAQVCKEHAQNAGFSTIHADSFYNFDVWRKEMEGQAPKSALNGELLYGNNNGIKNSLDRNYLSDALGTGNLTIKTLSKVTDITFNTETKKYTINIQQIDEQGNKKETTTHQCTYLFLCAGSLGTTELLLKAQEKGNLPDLNTEIGKGFGTNGNAFAIRKNINKPTGTIHSSPPTLSVLDYLNTIAPLTAMQDIFPIGIDLRMLLMVGQPYNEYKGVFNYDKNSDSLQLNWASNGMDQPKAAMGDFISKINNANNSDLDTSFIPEGVSSKFTYHPLGGVVLEKASDKYGRIKGYKNLYAIDGSMLPGNCALVNPSLTIAALAELNMEEIIKNDF